MSKVSSNAGKHPYLRTDEDEYKNLFSHLKFDHGGVLISVIKKPFFKIEVDTEYFDRDGEIIRYGDTLKFQKEEYIVDFREEWWVLVNIKDSKNVEILGEKANQSVLTKRYN